MLKVKIEKKNHDTKVTLHKTNWKQIMKLNSQIT